MGYKRVVGMSACHIAGHDGAAADQRLQGEKTTVERAPATTAASAAATQKQGLAQMQLSSRYPVLTCHSNLA